MARESPPRKAKSGASVMFYFMACERHHPESPTTVHLDDVNVPSPDVQPCSSAEGDTAPASLYRTLENDNCEYGCEVIISSSSSDLDSPVRHDKVASRGPRNSKSTGVQCRHCVGTSDECSCNNEVLSAKDAHTSQKKYVCKQCKHRTNKQYKLIKHLRTHTDKKVYKCEHCQYKASQLTYLEIHMRKHTGEKPFNCKQCMYRATQRSALKKHVRTHTGAKPYKCQQCKYCTADISNLIRHTTTHTKLNI
ncbi:Zinc finger protein 606 [Eumeta japonica]|uniref:Zinc finger protein 606 n=1 Tax=Eumeta variegata TaxID=151549 RepID=A0A4C1VFZ3_EUMVA|nr:Zinc finger protein 606 [Eumeta japonica]